MFRGHISTVLFLFPKWFWSALVLLGGPVGWLLFTGDKPSWISDSGWQALVGARQMIFGYWPLVLLLALLLLATYLYARLHALRSPQITIDFNDDSYFRRGESLGIDSPRVMFHTLYFKMTNIGPDRLKQCSVRLEDFVTDDGHRPYQDLPAPLERLDGAGLFDLRPQSPKLALLVSAEQDSNEPKIYLRLTERIDRNYENVWRQIGRGPYTATIGVFADNTSCVRKFRVYFDNKNVMRMKHVKK